MAGWGYSALVVTSTPAPVHTTGINIGSVLTIVSSVVVLISVIIGTFLRQQSKAINGATSGIVDRMQNTFETKEKVNNLAGRITYLEEKMADIQARMKL